jgi:hypothetical protein
LGLAAVHGEKLPIVSTGKNGGEIAPGISSYRGKERGNATAGRSGRETNTIGSSRFHGYYN